MGDLLHSYDPQLPFLMTMDVWIIVRIKRLAGQAAF
jgi:hypothetical protein